MSSSSGRAIGLTLGCVISLVILKAAVTAITGSISVLAQALDSFLDVLAVTITFFAVGAATKPADEKHPFGHGKIENISAVTQGILLFTAAALIIYSSIHRIISGEKITLTEAGIGVMAVSIIVSLWLSRYLLRVSRETDSPALEAVARNITADVYSAAGVLVGLAVIRFTNLSILDPIIALPIAGLIIRSGYKIVTKSFGALVDVRLPKSEEDIIVAALTEHTGQLAGFHEMRTRKAGSQRFIDLHLMLPKNISVEEAHRMCDHLEEDLKRKLANVSITIHVEPCDTTECGQCPVSDCSVRPPY